MGFNPASVAAVDVNEDNVMVAIIENAGLIYLERVETDLGRITIVYAEKRRWIMKGHCWSDRVMRKMLKGLSRRRGTGSSTY